MDKYRIPSIANTCTIFQLMTTSRKSMSASQIAKELDLPRTSVFRIMKTLEQEGMAHSIGGGYVMGHRLLNLGLNATSQIPERRLCVPILQKLTSVTGATSHFAIMSGNKALLMEVCDSPDSSRVASRPGTLADIHCSASGKCFLAFLPEQIREKMLEQICYTKHTDRTITNADTLRTELETVKAQGYAIDDEEYNKDVRCIGLPVFNLNGQMVGAIGITAEKSKLPKTTLSQTVQHVKMRQII